MKPYTLEWWLALYDECEILYKMCNEQISKRARDGRGSEIKYIVKSSTKFLALKFYIRSRIIKKYGE